MPSIDDLLNKISDFQCLVDGEEIVFSGILQKENGKYYSERKVPVEAIPEDGY